MFACSEVLTGSTASSESPQGVIFTPNGDCAIIDNAVICAWSKPAGDLPDYTAGSATDLNIGAPGATATWGKRGPQSGVYYKNGVNTGFFPLNGVTVNEAVNTLAGMNHYSVINNYTPGQFSDVNENSWFGFNKQQVVASAYEYGLMKGLSDTVFNPSGNVTVAEAITIAARTHCIYAAGKESFEQGSPWYQVYVDYVVANGIIAADDFDSYSRATSRAEMVYIFAHALPEAEFAAQNTVNSLPDINNDTPYRDAILLLYKAGVLTGSDALGTFNPGNNITRAEAAAIISRIILPKTRVSGKTFE